MSATNLSEMRRNYERGVLDDGALDRDPLVQLRDWLNEASAAKVIEPNAMTLATAGANGAPNARMVLCKGIDARGVVFYTNYGSAKGREIEANPRVALDFYWRELARQVRIQGAAERIGPTESDDYFRTRPRGSQLGAWVSKDQSQPITRAELEARLAELEKKYEGKEIPRPSFWGGYCVIPERFEFWLGGPDRLHDCIAYVRENSAWRRMRVSP